MQRYTFFLYPKRNFWTICKKVAKNWANPRKNTIFAIVFTVNYEIE